MNTRKIIQALGYLASKQPNKILDNMKAYKLLWLADRYHIRQYGRTISGDEYYALPLGMIPSDAKCILERQATKLDNQGGMTEEYLEILPNHQYRIKQMPDMNVFSETDVQALDLIIEHFNHLSAFELSELSHQFPEWKFYEKDLLNEKKKRAYKVNMNLFFENKEERSRLFMDDLQLLELTKAVYQQYKGY